MKILSEYIAELIVQARKGAAAANTVYTEPVTITVIVDCKGEQDKAIMELKVFPRPPAP